VAVERAVLCHQAACHEKKKEEQKEEGIGEDEELADHFR